MASPDLSSYINLSLYDLDPQDVYDSAVEALQTRLPDWVPREGNTEVLLLEALGLQVAESIFAINRLPDGIIEALLRFFSIERDTGAQPTVNLRFHMAGTLGYTIPAETEVRVDLPGGLEPVIFVTDVDLEVPVGSSSATITATGDRFTAEANGVASGTIVELIDALVHVDYVTLDTEIANGRDVEDEEQYLERGTQRLNRITDTLVIPSHFVSTALEQAYVSRATGLDNYNAAADIDQNGPVGNDPGHMTLAVYGSTAAVGASDKAALQSLLDSKAASQLVTHVIDATITTVDVTVTVKALEGWLPADIITNVQTKLDEYLDPQTWPWYGIVRRNELIQEISNAEGVDYIESLTVPAADITLAGVANLVDTGTINVTVNV
jgi:Baseplate J-like protein